MGKRSLFRRLRGEPRSPPPPPGTATPSVTTSATPSPRTPTNSSGTVGPATTPASAPNSNVASRNQALQRGIEAHLATIPAKEKDAFRSAADKMTDDSVLEQVRSYDQGHQSRSFLRPCSEPISRVLHLLDGFVDAIAIGIQANPAISSIVVGAARGIISMAIGFVEFFDKLTEMMSRMVDYLGSLTAYARSTDDSKLIEDCLVNVYIDLLTFFQRARQVFVDDKGNPRKWTSFRMFWRVQWLPFEKDFGGLEANMRHHLDVLNSTGEAILLWNERVRRQQELGLSFQRANESFRY